MGLAGSGGAMSADIVNMHDNASYVKEGEASTTEGASFGMRFRTGKQDKRRKSRKRKKGSKSSKIAMKRSGY